jgi:hypothetical protein
MTQIYTSLCIPGGQKSILIYNVQTADSNKHHKQFPIIGRHYVNLNPILNGKSKYHLFDDYYRFVQHSGKIAFKKQFVS